MTRWLVAKYMPDLHRREPINVGVVVVDDDGRVASRFAGEVGGANGDIDGRRLGAIRAGDNYRAWVSYWRSLAADGASWDELVVETQSATPSNYFLEVGGQTIVTDRSHAELVDYLFGLVVTKPVPASVPRRAPATAAADAIFRDLGVTVRRDVTVEIPLGESLLTDEVFFDYGYRNGHNTYMRALNLGTSRRRWEVVHAARYGFEVVQKHRMGSVISLVASVGEVPNAQLQLLKEWSTVIDVGDRPRALQLIGRELELE